MGDDLSYGLDTLGPLCLWQCLQITANISIGIHLQLSFGQSEKDPYSFLQIITKVEKNQTFAAAVWRRFSCESNDFQTWPRWPPQLTSDPANHHQTFIQLPNMIRTRNIFQKIMKYKYTVLLPTKYYTVF